ncbi:helix-turn-helix domain-containing protein [Vagococcus intermedius]|uniref:Helix-turn-helix domain-containing protein n=1 Tax=Vagococcus intermedius TaxID=2991418 RepID=A0AAF0CVE1_9ENTE|nr:helix-turn-helix domain-containing protein [Vagococcus intermedius]WEG73579.1 helix-turn-helix domain-containing protein [Vagococcus intermedius]WEG75661.1 helix-turn-helix domain-containing protein [Vagococcus intermedius]
MVPILFKRNELENLNILTSALYNSLDTSLDFVGKHILTDKSTVHHNLKQLNDTFNNLGYNTIKIRTIDNKIIVDGKKDIIYNNLLRDISCEYFLNSPVYRIIELLLNNKTLDKDSVIQNAYVSTSYLTKIMTKINLFFAPTGIKLVSRKGKLTYVGPSITKYYLDCRIQRVFTIIPSKNQNKKQPISNTLTSFNSDFEQKKAVILSHSLNAHYSKNDPFFNNPIVIQLLEVFIKINDIHQQTPIPTIQSQQTKLAINLVSRLSSDQIDTDKERGLIGQKLIQLHQLVPENSLLADSLYITEKFCELFDLPSEKISQLKMKALYSITLYLLAYSTFQCNVDQLFYFIPDFVIKRNQKKQKETDFLLKNLVADPKLSEISQKALLTYQFEISTSLENILPIDYQPLKIFIGINTQYYGRERLITRIHQFFSSQSIQIVLNTDEADIFICDYILEIGKESSFFLLIDINSSDSIKLLIDFITESLLKRQVRLS